MSTLPSISDSDFSADNADSYRVRWESSTRLERAITHVFLPFPLQPEPHNHTAEDDRLLARAVCAVSRAYSDLIDDTLKHQWRCIEKMLGNLETHIQSESQEIISHAYSQLRGMQTGDILAFFNRYRREAIILRKQDHCILCEPFKTIDSVPRLTCSYPEYAVEIPNEEFQQSFQSKFAHFLLCELQIAEHYNRPDVYTILQGVGRITEVHRITKRILSYAKSRLWTRSSLWLLIKVVIQTAFDRCGLGRVAYKAFMLHFMCCLAMDAINANLSSHLLHSISAKILRRLTKLGPSTPDWLHDRVLKTSASIREILEAQWKGVEAARRPPPSWNPSRLDLNGDTQLSLLGSLQYIQNSLANPASKRIGSPFCPQHLPRGTLNDFLSSNGKYFEEAYGVNPHVALYDVEQAVEQGIDDWVACVTDVDQACIQLEILMENYLSSSWHTYQNNPEHISIMLLTVIELWVALDKLVVTAVPILASYSPEISTELLYRPPSQNYGPPPPSPNHPRSHQFPIPAVASHLDVTVFELQCPVSLHVWRFATARLLGGINNVSVPYADIPRLQPFLLNRWTSPVTGYVYLNCAATELEVWKIFHHYPTRYLIESHEQFLFYWRPSTHMLHQYGNATTHTSNPVLVAQASCTNGLTSSEFIAFGHLRSGGSLQWLNILRELRSRTLNFRHDDVYLLLNQAACQVGPFNLNTAEWAWHQELQGSSFCYALLDELESLLVDVGVCSLDGVMMGTISFLLTRLLASCCYEDILEQGIRLLRQVRTKTFEWVQELSYGLMIAPTNPERRKLLTDMAATCRSTFDVDPAIFHKLLYSAEDVDALISCAIFIRANSSVDLELNPNSSLAGVSEYSRLLRERDRRLSLALEGVLRDVILADASNRGIDLAVRNVWSGYRPGPQSWQPSPHPNPHWLTCETAATGSRHSQLVHFNLLDGTLLVDGKPINGLPPEIRKQALYRRIFGNQDFLAIASGLPGMGLSTLALISDHRVHFALQGGDLQIRAQHRDMADILEVIPHEKLRGDLPTAFVHGHIHWLNLSTHTIELRPLKEIWENSSDNWRIDCATGQYRMFKGHECLVDMHSPTWEMVSGRLECLDVAENLTITTFPIDTSTSQFSPVRRLSVVLRRYGLSFFVNEDGDLESRDFNDMVYDENQCIGTLLGFENRLVLRPNVQIEEKLVHRCIVVPDGPFPGERNSHQSLLSKTNHESPHQSIAYHTYRVNTDLGCLTGYTSWRSKLYLAQLHAQTSVDWMPDPLTGRTGIQEALRLLQSAGCWSITELETRHEKPKLLSSPNFTTYPQISFAIKQMNYRIGREKFLRADQNKSDLLTTPRPHLDVVAALRADYLFPFEDAGPNMPTRNPVQSPRQVSAPPSPSGENCCTPGKVTLGKLLLDRCAPNLSPPSRLRNSGAQGNRLSSDPDTHTLNKLFASIQINNTDPSFKKQYISRLHNSTRHVRESSRMTCRVTWRPSTEELRKHYVQCRDNYIVGLTSVQKELGPMDDLGYALDRLGQWPQITPNTLFRCLASTSSIKLPDGWKQCLVSLALLLVEFQRSRRLLRHSLDNLEEELSRELENKGCDGWSAEEYPDWLLIQLQGDFVIRGTQADVAHKMISPPSGKNTTMQVNMGEGKSSVILPISAAALADGNKLVRVIVPKALAVQTFRLLVDRLGGLVNRPIYHLPFSRPLTGKYSHQQFTMLRELLSECVRDRGILVVQPEHVLSLKLTSVEKQIPRHLSGDDNGDHASSDVLLELQRWVQSCSRDILDEIDEILHPRFQLSYTIGRQQHIQGYPDRWTITQQILTLVRKHALSLSHDLPDAIEYELDASGSFPRIRILRASDARQRLISLIIDDVMDGHLPDFNFRDIDHDRRLRAAVRAFISSKDVSQRTASTVKEYAQQSVLWDGILLLRGLLACNILLFAVAERRWRVDYGLFLMRTMLAVPYRAKDVPAPRAEFGHPDITIVLTCLSYYYGGLTEEQLRASFEILQQKDDPSMEYATWLRDFEPDSVPDCIQDVSNVNIKSSEQWDNYLFPLFARNQGAINFYLSRVVFPKEAKEIPWKLVASSWDLAELREHPITGFSGTNDYQDLLPTSITQRDLDHQRGTTARVLSQLLQSENNSYALISHANGNRRTTLELLKMVVDQDPEIRVFLDVGAQILDLSNYQVAKTWLGLGSASEGAVYFNEDDELMVLTKDGHCRSLISSPLAQQLDRCVVYLDDAHTRGTDLKFPNGFRAAVTLGPKVTKDRLVQGCMRMRKLGHGHSVMFFAPLEVDGSIRAVSANLKDDHSIVAIHETWTDIQERAPYWAQQGISHNSRYDAWTRFCSNEFTREQLADAWLQPELKSLANLYAPFQGQNGSSCSSGVLDDYPELQEHCINLGVLKLPVAQMEEEQEREVNREVEREREIQQPPKAIPATHSIHQEVVSFVRTGVIPPLHDGGAFRPVFTTLEQSSAATSEAHMWSPFILATTDFCKTIDRASWHGMVDQYLRPVQWILSGKGDLGRVLVILSPFEVDCLMPDIRVSKSVHLHVYTPRTTKYIRPADDLMFYSIPPVPDGWTPPWDLMDELNVFAGQPYLRDHETYLRLRRFLGIHEKDLPKSAGTAIRRNLITPGVLEEIRNTTKDSLLPSVMMLLAMRRRGLPFAETHMGKILQGQVLTDEDFKGLVWTKTGRNPIGDTRTLHGVTSATTGEDGPACSTLPRSSKRGRQMVDPSDADSGQSQKRLRAGKQEMSA
ncbi:hypothetical protein OG21DRAFT_1601805 [Imleria badia]|nr:hypothetical protein OG21DRAFT_1601805 [Imleria badia]